MNLFEKIIKNKDLKCDICGSTMIVMYGCGWDNDRLICSDRESCGAEIEFPTTTEYKEITEETVSCYDCRNNQNNEICKCCYGWSAFRRN